MFDRVLIPLDGSPRAESVVHHTLRLLSVPDVEVDLLVVVDMEGKIAPGSVPVTCSGHAAKQYLAQVAGILTGRGIRAVTDVRFGPAAPKILEHAEQSHASMIAMSTHGRSGLERLVHGSTAEAVLRQTPVPLLLVRGTENVPAAPPGDTPLRILVPLDGTADGEAILPYVRNLARRLQARVELLRVIEFIPVLHGDEGVMEGAFDHLTLGASEYLRAIGARVRQEGIETEQTVVRSSPANGILERGNSGSVDLVAMSTHGRTGLRRLLLGSVAESVLRELRVPLLTVRVAIPAHAEPERSR